MHEIVLIWAISVIVGVYARVVWLMAKAPGRSHLPDYRDKLIGGTLLSLGWITVVLSLVYIIYYVSRRLMLWV